MEDQINERDKQNSFIHTVLKSALYGLISSTALCIKYSPFIKVKETKEEFKSNEIRRLIAAWDLGMEDWSNSQEHWKDYREKQHYKDLLFIRNAFLTVFDNDGAYLQLIYRMLKAWETVKEDDKYLH